MAGDWMQFPHHWLEEKCPSYSKPFHLPIDLIAKLHKLEQINKQCDFDADQVINILEQVNSEYTALALHSQAEVDKVKGPFTELKKGRKCESTVLSSGCQLDSKRAMVTNIDKKLENIQLNREKFRLKKECKVLKEEIAEYQNIMANLEREVTAARKETEEKKSLLLQEEGEIQTEIEKAKRNLEELQEQLNFMEVSEDMYSDVLMEEMKELDALKRENRELNANMAKYKDLPPSILEAKKMVRQARLEEAKIAEKVKKATMDIV